MSALRARTLILVENLPVPFDRRVWQEARSLVAAGYDVTVVCPAGTEVDVEPHATIDGVEIHRYALLDGRRGGPLSYVGEYGTALLRMRRLVRDLDARSPFDVLHACNPPDLLLLTGLSMRRRGTAFVFDHHDLVPELYRSRFGRRGPLYLGTRAAERLSFALADVVLSPNESYRSVAVDRGRVNPDDVFVVRSAPDTECFRRGEPDETLRFGKPHLLAYLGVMAPQDGVDYALRALAALHHQRDDWHATFIGSGPAHEEMRSLATALRLDQVVDFTGRIPDEDVIRILSSADVCLAPDPASSFNDASTMNKVVEYMALSRPIVSFDLPETRVSAADAAIYAPPNDVDGFALCIAGLLDAPERAEQMGAKGRERVTTELSWRRSERQLLAGYERALAKALARHADPQHAPA